MRWSPGQEDVIHRAQRSQPIGSVGSKLRLESPAEGEGLQFDRRKREATRLGIKWNNCAHSRSLSSSRSHTRLERRSNRARLFFSILLAQRDCLLLARIKAPLKRLLAFKSAFNGRSRLAFARPFVAYGNQQVGRQTNERRRSSRVVSSSRVEPRSRVADWESTQTNRLEIQHSHTIGLCKEERLLFVAEKRFSSPVPLVRSGCDIRAARERDSPSQDGSRVWCLLWIEAN